MFTRAHLFDIAQRYIGTTEVGGSVDNPLIVAMLKLDLDWGDHPVMDEIPWCSAWANWVCWHVRAPRSKSVRARSWLEVGRGINLDDAEPGDVIVLKRGSGPQPGPDVIDAPGHVGFYAGRTGGLIEVLGGNQSDTVKVSRYPKSKLLAVRRLL